jgi:hypothetical protein
MTHKTKNVSKYKILINGGTVWKIKFVSKAQKPVMVSKDMCEQVSKAIYNSQVKHKQNGGIRQNDNIIDFYSKYY